jgi:hypothetical protein
MSRETILTLGFVVVPFVVFALAVAWGEFQTRRART